MTGLDTDRIKIAGRCVSAVINTLNSSEFSFALLAFRKDALGEVEVGMVCEGDPKLIIEALETGAKEIKKDENL
jgi:hypothetical protein